MKITLLLLILASLALSQIMGDQPLSMMMKSKYPIPDWITPGLVAVYRYQGGSRTMSDMGEPSGFYGSGYALMMVTNVSRNAIYGLTLSYIFHQQIYLNAPKVSTLYGQIYVDPREIMEMLDQREEYARQGITVQGGEIGNGLIFLSISYGGTTYAITVNQRGEVLKLSLKSTTPNGSSVSDLEFMGYTRIDWPNLNGFPDVADESHSYSVYAYSQMAGMGVPTGMIQITPTGNQGDFLKVYRQTFSSSQAPMPITTTLYGLPCYGPHYMHPDLLRRQVILDIPDINFSWHNQMTEYGMATVISVGGQNVMIVIFDDRGLATKVQTVMGDLISVVQLQY